jgi:uncharacterized protein (TIGR03790 family)
MRSHSYNRSVILAALIPLVLAASTARAQSSANLLLVINTSSTASQEIGDYYTRARAVPQDNILRIAVEPTEQVARQTFERQIEAPIAKWFNVRGAHDRILYIVLTKGIPLRIAGTTGRNGTVASVDSELALLYRRFLGIPLPFEGPIPNPYFLGDRAVTEARPFTHEIADIYLVARLDAFSVDDVKALIDRGIAPARTGRFALDEKLALTNDVGNRWLGRSADLLKTMGFGERVVLDSSSRVLSDETDLLGYFSWGSNDPAFKIRSPKLGFVPGALAALFVSTDARTFREPPPNWTTGPWEDQRTYFEGSPQSLIGDLIRSGVTGVAGHVAEPYLDTTIRPDVLFPAYVSGLNLVESFYLAMPALSWQTVVIGDPLCAPFRQRELTARDIDKGIDAATEFPTFVSKRILQILSKASAMPEAVRLAVRANSRLARNDQAGAREALEQATALDDRLLNAHSMLGMLYDQAGEHAKAIARYRHILTLAPANALAMNNLAYALATHQGDLQEALALARKAHTLASNDPSIADTLAWILHLSGDHAEARRLIATALAAAGSNPQVQLHAAIIHAAAGQYDTASRHLARALELSPELDSEQGVKQLRAKLAQASKPHTAFQN